MVIANSDSNTTLVSLNNNDFADKHGPIGENIVVVGETGLLRYAQHSSSATTTAVSRNNNFDDGLPTELMISVPAASGESSTEKLVPLYLPFEEHQSLYEQNNLELDVDEFVSRNYYNIDNESSGYCCNIDDRTKTPSRLLPGAESLAESRKQLLASLESRTPKQQQQQNSLYIAQGERANATSEHYDVLMSDKATTCHILALHSSTASSNNLPLGSLTHIDGAHYEDCVRGMVCDHIEYHRRLQKSSRKRNRSKQCSLVEEKKSEDQEREESSPGDEERESITIDIHVMGGFNDIDSSSASITDWLLRLLADMAQEFKDTQTGVKMVIKTLVVSSANNQFDGCHDSPIGRGLGIDLRTGKVFLADSKTSGSSGPVPVLRSVRLWSRCNTQHQPHRLSVVHCFAEAEKVWASLGVKNNDRGRSRCSLFTVQPFRMRSIHGVDALLGLPDDVLLKYTSTSPDVEEADFCTDLRASLRFLKHQCVAKGEDGRSYFGENLNRPMIFAKICPNPKQPSSQQGEEWKLLSQ